MTSSKLKTKFWGDYFGTLPSNEWINPWYYFVQFDCDSFFYFFFVFKHIQPFIKIISNNSSVKNVSFDFNFDSRAFRLSWMWVLGIGRGLHYSSRAPSCLPAGFVPLLLVFTFRTWNSCSNAGRFPWEQDECLPLARDWNKSTRATANKRGCRVSFVGLFCSFLDNWGKMKLDNQSGKIKEDQKKSGASKYVTIWK